MLLRTDFVVLFLRSDNLQGMGYMRLVRLRLAPGNMLLTSASNRRTLPGTKTVT